MSLVDEIKSIPPEGCCTTGAWYDQQDTADRKAFDEYLADVTERRRKTYAPLYEVCCQHGLKISLKSFKEHIMNHASR